MSRWRFAREPAYELTTQDTSYHGGNSRFPPYAPFPTALAFLAGCLRPREAASGGWKSEHAGWHVRLVDRAIVRALPAIPRPVVRRVAQRYIAGAELADACRVVKQQNAAGKLATVDVLGE